ncbi:MAG TPA: tetratricopeptide repeat protein [Phycisphaerales bacterium]|nr:tetratricopeptide repeat protein [Phycisphaerales bacterium]HMP37562.1 tetratricopeptide repeat protein [Phycisphaerales bacterium]
MSNSSSWSNWHDAEDHVTRAMAHFERGRWAEAETELRKALAVRPDRGEWQFNLGLTLEAAGRDPEAVECYRRAAELMPEEADPLLAAGALSHGLGEHEEAIALLERAALLRRDDDGIYAIWIESLVALDRLEEAETVFHLALQGCTECPRSLAAVAESLVRRGLTARAEWCLREAMRLEPTLPRLRARLAGVFARMGRSERAVQLYWRELRENPGDIETLFDFGNLLAQLGRLAEAEERFRRILELEPANVAAHRRLGDLALQTGRLDRSLLEYELVAKLDPAADGIHLDVAECLLALGRSEEAWEHLQAELDLRHAEESDPDPARFGSLLLRAGKPEKATPLLELAAETAPTAETLRLLALAKYETGDLRGGVRVSRAALRLDPKCVRSHHNIALATLRLGRPRSASAWMRAGLKIDRHDDGLRRLRMRILAARVLAWVGVRARF